MAFKTSYKASESVVRHPKNDAQKKCLLFGMIDLAVFDL